MSSTASAPSASSAPSALRNAVSSLVQVVLSAVVIFLLYRFVLHQLGTRDFGIWALVLAATSLVGLSNMGLTSSIIKHVAESHAKGDLRHVAELIETSALCVGALSLLIACAGYPLMRGYFAFSLDDGAFHTAMGILPLSLVAFCLSMITSIYHSGLYGCHLIVRRNAILVFDSVGYLMFCLWLAPAHGLTGLIDARVLQNFLTLMLSVSTLRQSVPTLSLVAWRWTGASFRELIGYAFSLQVVGLLSLAMDPLTKGLLSRFGSLDMVTYYEMGNRLVGQIRSIIVSANQVLLPTFARTSRGDVSAIAGLFERSYAVVFYVTLCIFSVSMAALPLIGVVWLGGDQTLFVDFALILWIGSLINTLSVPAYFAALGTGALRPVIYSHVIMATVNIVLSYGLGRSIGGVGVVWGWSAALSAGGLAAHGLYCRSATPSVRDWLPRGGLRLVAFAGIGLTSGFLARSWLHHHDDAAPGGLFCACVTLGCFVAVFFVPAWFHPIRRELVERLTRSRQRLTEVPGAC